MAEEFTPITTQEQLDRIIGNRLEQERKKYADYEEIKNSVGEKDKRIKELEDKEKDLTGKLSKAETDSVKTRIAHETGLPFEVGSRLKGSTEEEIRKDAESLKSLFDEKKPTQPPYRSEKRQTEKDENTAVFADISRKLSGDE